MTITVGRKLLIIELNLQGKIMSGPLNSADVCDKILKQGMKATESTPYFLENVTKGVQETGKGALTVDSGKRAGTDIFKASKDFARGDTVCGGLFSVSVGCEVIAGVGVRYLVKSLLYRL